MKRKIAIVCALLAGRNTGMYTVDRSAFEFFENFAPNTEVTYYTLGDPACAGFSPDELGFSYLNLKDHASDFLASDLIVYWGDFVHAWSYWEADLLGRMITQGLVDDRSEALDLAYRLLLLEGASDELIGRVVVFGGTLITNKADQLADVRYRTALDRLLEHAHGVFFRDSLSASYAAQLRENHPTQGSDCALLLPDSRPLIEKPGEIGVYFGRTNWIAQSLLFARLVAKFSNRKARWLPWLPSLKRRAMIAKLGGFMIDRGKPSADELLTRVKACDAIVTDTYHLCVNAWRMGVPAICIGHGAERNNNTLGDKKKESLYGMIGAQDYYVFHEEVMFSAGLSGALARTCGALRNRPAIDIIIENTHRHSLSARHRLDHACREVLSK